ncbi:MAG TPA: hypothetical protein VI653_05005 [Steroidobacteraceae bacterium]
MATNPTTPNQADYISFLYRVVGIPVTSLPTVVGTATGGSLTTLVDATRTWTVNQFASPFSYVCLDTAGGQLGYVASNNPTTLTFAPSLSAPVSAGDGYVLMPDVVQSTLSLALEIVNETLACASALLYVQAVYNLAADRLINFADDDSIIANQTYFADLRTKLRISEVSLGVISATSNETSSSTVLNPEAMKTFTLQDLQTLKTPYGRNYMGIAQAYGPNIWGLT